MVDNGRSARRLWHIVGWNKGVYICFFTLVCCWTSRDMLPDLQEGHRPVRSEFFTKRSAAPREFSTIDVSDLQVTSLFGWTQWVATLIVLEAIALTFLSPAVDEKAAERFHSCELFVCIKGSSDSFSKTLCSKTAS